MRKKLLLFLTLFFLTFCFISNLFAITVKKQGDVESDDYMEYYYDSSNSNVEYYCIEKGAHSPKDATCSEDNSVLSLTDKDRIVLGYIISNGISSTDDDSTKQYEYPDYKWRQALIWQFLHDKHSGEELKNSTLKNCFTTNNASDDSLCASFRLYKERAYAIYNFNPSISLGDFTKNAQNYTATYTVSDLIDQYSCSVSAGKYYASKLKGSISIDQTNRIVTYTPKSGDTGNNSDKIYVELVCTSKYNKATLYDCGSDKQPVARFGSYTHTVRKKSEKTLAPDIRYFQIKKVDDDNKPLQYVRFQLKDSNGNTISSCFTDAAGNCNLWGINGVTYKIHEVTYNVDSYAVLLGCNQSIGYQSIGYQSIGYQSIEKCVENKGIPKAGIDYTLISDQEITINNTFSSNSSSPTKLWEDNNGYIFVNKKTCAKRFNDAKAANSDGGTVVTMKERIEIYSHYKYRRLLDTSKETASEACSDYTPEEEIGTSCFSGHYNREKINGFNINNLSNFDEEITFNQNSNTIKGFCLNSVFFNDDGETNQNETRSGVLLYKKQFATESTFTKKCYLYNASTFNPYTGTIPDSINTTYDKYVKDVKLDWKEKSNAKTEDGSYTFNKQVSKEPVITLNGGMYQYTVSYNYNFPEIWSTRGNANTHYDEDAKKVLYGSKTKCEDSGSPCISIGYGLITKFTSNYSDFQFKYSLCKFGNCNSETDWDNRIGECVFTVTPQLVEDNKLQLEFRIIKTANPFPGKSGNGRNVGSNWKGSDGNNSSSCNLTILSTITYRPDSSGYGYDESGNRKKVAARYTIVLNPSIIEAIRDDNKAINYEYDKFEQKVHNSDYNRDVNRYLSDLKNRYSDSFKYDYWDYPQKYNKYISDAEELANNLPNSCIKQQYLSSTDKHTASEFGEMGYLVDTLTENKTKLTAKSSTGITYSNLNGTCITDNDPEKGYWIVYKLVNSATDKKSYSNYEVTGYYEKGKRVYKISGDPEPSLNPNHVYYLRADVTMTDESCDGGSKNKTAKFRFSNYYHIDPLNPKYGSSVFGYGNPVVNLDITQKLLSENNNKVSILLYGGWQSKESAPCDITYTTAASPNRNRNCYAGGADAIQIGTMPRACGVKVCFKNIVILDLNEYFDKDYTVDDVNGTNAASFKSELDKNVNIDNYITYTLGNN